MTLLSNAIVVTQKLLIFYEHSTKQSFDIGYLKTLQLFSINN